MAFGIDASNVNGPIHWAAVAGQASPRIEFAHLKASEGASFIDPNFLTNMAQASAAGLHVGPYHFARPDHHPGIAGARAEAQFFVTRLREVHFDIPPVLDLEVGSGNLTPWAGAFLSEVERLTGVRPILYTYTAFAQAHLSLKALAGYRLWIADYGRNDGLDHGTRTPNVEHQFTSRAVVHGVLGHVDENFAPSLDALLIAKPKPSPKPVPSPPTTPVPAGEPKNETPFKRAWPVPVPAWFWNWAQWRIDGKTYPRPLDAPSVIPPWAWVRLSHL